MAIANVSYYGYTPTYAGQPIEEAKDYHKALADEYDVTRDAGDKIDAVLSSISSPFQKDTAYINTVKDNLRKSISSIATDMQGGVRYETARNQIRDIASKINNDPLLAKIKENAQVRKDNDTISRKLAAEGHLPLVFNRNDDFSSINDKGELVTYNEQVQPRGQWQEAKQQIINGVKPEIQSFIDNEYKEYLKTGVMTKLGREQFERVGNAMVATYLNKAEGVQELSHLLEQNKNLTKDEVFNQLREQMLKQASIGEYQVEQANYQLRPDYDKEFNEFARREKYKRELKEGQGSGVVDNTSAFVSPKTIDAVPTKSKWHDISNDHFKDGKLKEDVSSAGDFAAGVVNSMTGAAPVKSNTLKERKHIDDARKFLAINGFNTRMNDFDVNKKMTEIGREIFTRDVMSINGLYLDGLQQSNKIPTTNNVNFHMNGQFKELKSGGKTKSLSEMLGTTNAHDILSVTFEGFSSVADPSNNEKVGDLIYTVKSKNKTVKVAQNAENVDSDLSKSFNNINELLKPLHEANIHSDSSLTHGKKFNAEKEGIPLTNLINVASAEAVALIPVFGYDKGKNKLTYELQPKIKVDDTYYDFNNNELNGLVSKGKLSPEDKDEYSQLLTLFLMKSSNHSTINYSDIKSELARTINSNPFMQEAALTAKNRNEQIQQSNNYQQNFTND